MPTWYCHKQGSCSVTLRLHIDLILSRIFVILLLYTGEKHFSGILFCFCPWQCDYSFCNRSWKCSNYTTLKKGTSWFLTRRVVDEPIWYPFGPGTACRNSRKSYFREVYLLSRQEIRSSREKKKIISIWIPLYLLGIEAEKSIKRLGGFVGKKEEKRRNIEVEQVRIGKKGERVR